MDFELKNIKDPLSSCFAIPSELIKRIPIEGTGDELLLEILVKLRATRQKDVMITEIPYDYDAKHGSKKLDSARITSYLGAVWNLYRYGQKSNRQSDMILTERTKHKSISFLSKAGRFFTVGASGLAVNFLVSLIFSNLVPNVWYIQATLVGVLASISSNFLLNKIWTFEDRDFSLKHVLKQYLLFLVLWVLWFNYR